MGQFDSVADSLKLIVYARAACGVERKRVGVHVKRCPLAVFVGKAEISYLQFVYAGLVKLHGCVGGRCRCRRTVVDHVLVGSRVCACRPGKYAVGVGKTRYGNAGLGAVDCVDVAPQRFRLVLEHSLYLDFVLFAKDNVVTFERKLVCFGSKHLCADLHFVGNCAFDFRPRKHALRQSNVCRSCGVGLVDDNSRCRSGIVTVGNSLDSDVEFACRQVFDVKFCFGTEIVLLVADCYDVVLRVVDYAPAKQTCRRIVGNVVNRGKSSVEHKRCD